ncbi:enolase-phosphatase E1-like [Rhopilema esculentum]|uniref:enolase-phosphatase E1-like n=1 Tax=Rhopilema esculentum TaxID=499914 RepID=UPI0031DEC32C
MNISDDMFQPMFDEVANIKPNEIHLNLRKETICQEVPDDSKKDDDEEKSNGLADSRTVFVEGPLSTEDEETKMFENGQGYDKEGNEKEIPDDAKKDDDEEKSNGLTDSRTVFVEGPLSTEDEETKMFENGQGYDKESNEKKVPDDSKKDDDEEKSNGLTDSRTVFVEGPLSTEDEETKVFENGQGYDKESNEKEVPDDSKKDDDEEKSNGLADSRTVFVEGPLSTEDEETKMFENGQGYDKEGNEKEVPDYAKKDDDEGKSNGLTDSRTVFVEGPLSTEDEEMKMFENGQGYDKEGNEKEVPDDAKKDDDEEKSNGLTDSRTVFVEGPLSTEDEETKMFENEQGYDKESNENEVPDDAKKDDDEEKSNGLTDSRTVFVEGPLSMEDEETKMFENGQGYDKESNENEVPDDAKKDDDEEKSNGLTDSRTVFVEGPLSTEDEETKMFENGQGYDKESNEKEVPDDAKKDDDEEKSNGLTDSRTVFVEGPLSTEDEESKMFENGQGYDKEGNEKEVPDDAKKDDDEEKSNGLTDSRTVFVEGPLSTEDEETKMFENGQGYDKEGIEKEVPDDAKKDDDEEKSNGLTDSRTVFVEGPLSTEDEETKI